MTERPEVPHGGISITTEGDGVKEGTVMWVAVAALVVGLVGGVWGTMAWLRYDPSTEYVEAMAELDARLEASRDSLRVSREATERADAKAAEAEEVAQAVSDAWAVARDEAAEWRRQLDSIPNLSLPPVVWATIEAREGECEACAVTVAKHELTIGALQEAMLERDRTLERLWNDNAGLEEALDIARAEVSQAAGKIDGWKVIVGAGVLLLGGAIVIAS